MARKAAAKRELIDTGTDKRYVRRDEQGQFVESDDVGRSLSQDVRKHAKTEAGPGQGDKGDRPRPAPKAKAAPKGTKKTAAKATIKKAATKKVVTKESGASATAKKPAAKTAAPKKSTAKKSTAEKAAPRAKKAAGAPGVEG